MKKLFIKIKNFFFCLKYPFWRAKNVWTGEPCDYSFTWYGDIPEGWRIAFGKQLSKDIKKAGKATRKIAGKYIKWKDMLSFQQIKEKWGELCLYASASNEIQKVLDRYELISSGYCVCCGKPARYRTSGWVSYQCEKCFKAYLGLHVNQDDIEKELKESRLTKKDIPELTSYDYEIIKTEHLVDENLREERFRELCDEDEPGDIFYKKGYDDELGTYTIEYIKTIKTKVDLKEKYNIDFEEMWDLK